MRSCGIVSLSEITAHGPPLREGEGLRFHRIYSTYLCREGNRIWVLKVIYCVR